MDDVSSKRFQDMIRARLQEQFLDEPTFSDARSLVNVLESIVDSVDTEDEPAGMRGEAVDDAAEVQDLERGIREIEAELAARRVHLAHLKAAVVMAPPPVAGNVRVVLCRLHGSFGSHPLCSTRGRHPLTLGDRNSARPDCCDRR